MDKRRKLVPGDERANKVSIQAPVIDLNEVPPDPVETIDVSGKSKDVVRERLPRTFSIQLCFHKEDMEVLKQKYKVLGSSKVTNNIYFKNLGFEVGTNTLMLIKDKRVKYHGKSLQALARSWFKTERPPKDKGNEYDAETIAATELLRAFIKDANDQACSARRKGKEKVQEHVSYTFWPPHAKKKRTPMPKMRSSNAKLRIK